MNSKSLNFSEVAVVILNYNGLHHLRRFMPDVVKNTPSEVKLIVADNASTDDSVAFLTDQYESVGLIQLEKNYGFAEGYNRALRQVNAKYFVLLNSDVSPASGWLEPLIAWLDQDVKHAAVQPKIKAVDNKQKFEFAGASGGFIDTWCYPFCRGRIFFDTEYDEGQYDDTKEVFWASGAALAIKADLYKKFEGLDGSYFAHMEEIDLCWRLKRAGFSIGVVPKALVYHLGGGTLPQESPGKVYLNFRNSLKTILKNVPGKKLFWFLIFRLLLDGLAAGFYIYQGRWSFFGAVFKAHLSFYKSFSKILTSRKRSNKIIDAYRVGKPSNAGLYSKSIIADYFIRGKKTFSALNIKS